MQDLQRMEHRQSDQKRAGGSLRRAEQSCHRELRSSVTAHFTVENSTAEVTYVLEKDQPLVRVELKVDWKEIAKTSFQVLTWQTLLSYQTECLPL